MALQGDLKDFHLNDIIQLIHMGKQTGAIHIDTATAHGVIYFEDGEAVHATIGDQATGERAVFQILHWLEGEFTFLPNQTTTERSISMNVQNLVMEGTRQIDEWERLRDLIPSLDIVVKFNSDPGSSTQDINLHPKEWKVLSLVNGLRSVREIAAQCGLSEFETCKTLYGLISSGLLAVVKDAPVKPAEPVTITDNAPAATQTPPSPAKRAIPSDQDPSKSSIWNIFGIGGAKKEKEREKRESAVDIPPEQLQRIRNDDSPPQLEAMETFINALLDDYETPKGLFPAVKFSMPLAQRIRKYEQKFPAMKYVLVKDGRIDTLYAESQVQSGGAEQQDILFGLGDIAQDLLEDAKKSLTPRSAVSRYNATFDRIFKDHFDIRALELGAFIKKASP